MKTEIHLKMDNRVEKRCRNLINNSEGFSYTLKPFSKNCKKLRFGRIDFLIIGMASALLLSAFLTR